MTTDSGYTGKVCLYQIQPVRLLWGLKPSGTVLYVKPQLSDILKLFIRQNIIVHHEL